MSSKSLLLEPGKGVPRKLFLFSSLGLVLAVPFISLFFQVSLVKGESMQPTVHDGDKVLVDMLSVRMGNINRFDIVIIESPENPGERYIKRIVGLPGERISIRKGRLEVNGKILPEFFPKIGQIYDSREWLVPEGCYFVLGDNRPVSYDSRDFGFVPKAFIKGKVRLCVWPIAHAGPLPDM